MSSTPNNVASTPGTAQQPPQGNTADTTVGISPTLEERASSPTYAQVAARPPSPRMNSKASSGPSMPAPPPPSPLAEGSPDVAPFTQRGAAPSEDDELGWTTVAGPAKSKKSKTKKAKAKGKGKAVASTPPPPPQANLTPALPTPEASPRGSEPRKRRRTDYDGEDLTTDKQQKAPPSLLLSSKSPLLFERSPSLLSFSADTARPNADDITEEEDGMDVDPEDDQGAYDYGQPHLLQRSTPASWDTPRYNRFEHLEPVESGSSSRPTKGHKRSGARSNITISIDGSPIATPAHLPATMLPQTPTQQQRSHTRTATPAAPPRTLGKFLKKRDVDRSPTPASTHAQRASSDEEMLPASDTPTRSPSTSRGETSNRHPTRGRGRYSVYAIGNPPVQRTPSPELTPYDLLLANPDLIIAPPGLLKKTQGDRADWKKKDMDVKQAKAWNDLGRSRPLIVVQFGEHSAEEAGTNERVADLLLLLSTISEDCDVLINPAHGPVEKRLGVDVKDIPLNKEPYWFAIENLPEEWCLALARAAWLRYKNHALNFALWRNDLPTLCASFRSVFRFKARSREQYVAIVRRELLNSELRDVLLDVLLRDIDGGGKWRRALQDDAVGAILDSVDVEVYNCRITAHTSEDIAFIHITSPTADWQDWTRFRDAVQKHGFGSSAAGHPIPFLGRVFCGFCHSLGHPTGACPARAFFFPRQQASQSAQPQRTAPPARGGHRGRGGRGNGHGRGGMSRGL
ncbi:hypothetical protein EVJ58_g9555 [Rhodofomes roseus]|uniref:Uncharacterized protein n=1 Tax=Rhodofomes roseus TaxID=34475 RepID=A0A4Y9XXD1_9APHY|nr:hypothetical protein EVJ58_g9555 [Rhodofomes roseus]